MSFEVYIGKYNCPNFPELHNKDAYGFYDFQKSIFALTPTEFENDTACILEAIIFQIIHHCPPNGIEVYLFQPIASNRFNEIKRIYAGTKKSIGEQFFNEREAIESLQSLSEQVTRRYADFASAQVADIFSYNQKLRTPKPLIFYIIDNVEILLQNKNTTNALCNIIDQGSRAGVYLVLQYNDESYQQASKYNNYDDEMLYQLLHNQLPKMFGINLYSKTEIFINMDDRYSQFIRDFGYQPKLNDGFIQSLADKFLKKFTDDIRNNSEQDFIKVKIGEYQNHDVYFSIGPASMSYYTLISGGSDSGKSTLLQDIVLSVCEQYSPAEVQLFLMDFAGVTFNLLENTVPHIPFTVLETCDTDKLKAMFAYIQQEGERRSQLYIDLSNKTGKKVDKITTYRRLSGKELPIIILFFDELQKLFFVQDYDLVQEASRFINTLANEVRKFGIFIVLSTQSYSNINLKLSEFFSNCNVRIGLKPTDRYDFVALMGQSNDGYKQINNTPKRRQLIFNDDSGNPEANLLVTNNYVTDDIVNQRLKNLKEKYPINDKITNPVIQGINNQLAKNKQEKYDNLDKDDDIPNMFQ